MLQQQWWRTGYVQEKLLTGSRRGVNGTRLRHWGLQGYSQVWQQAGDGAALHRPLVRFYVAQGGGRPSTVPYVQFHIPGGRGQLSTVSCVNFYIAERGDGSLTSPVFDFI